MNKHAMAILTPVTLGLIVLTFGCAETTQVTPGPQVAPAAPSAASPRAKVFPSLDGAPTEDQAILDSVQQAVEAYIAELIMSGQPVPAGEYAALRSVEEARSELRELEAQWVSTQTVIGDHIMGGQPVPDYEYATLRDIESNRQAVLMNHGLVDWDE